MGVTSQSRSSKQLFEDATCRSCNVANCPDDTAVEPLKYDRRSSVTHITASMQMRSFRSIKFAFSVLFVVLNLSCVTSVRESKYYDLLGVAHDADEPTIKKAYRKQAMYV